MVACMIDSFRPGETGVEHDGDDGTGDDNDESEPWLGDWSLLIDCNLDASESIGLAS